jgi:eukaryotic-like serine/threonine-protein kinase
MHNPTNSHPDQTLLTHYGQGRLAEIDSDAIETHLSNCESCRQALETVPADPFIALLRSASDRTDRPPLALHFGYERMEELGRGGMGIVYRARQIGLNRPVALKLIRHGVDASPAIVARFRREAEAFARLHHPNVVQVYEVGEQNDQPFLALELVEGPSLAENLTAGPLEPREAAGLIAILARAVTHAHSRGIVHRDLKPANVLLQMLTASAVSGANSETPRSTSHCQLRSNICTPKITDFGLAKHLYSAGPGPTETGAVLGSPCYMAPEQTLARPELVGPATDVYALGAILYECLTGRPPLQGPTVLETLRQVADDEPVGVRRLQPAVPLDLETICHKCLRKEPGGRYASAEALTDDLERFLRGEPVRARPTGRMERAGKWARRKPALAALVGLLAVLPFAAVLGIVAHESQLRAQVQRAENSAAESLRQQQRADRNYRMARDSIGRMLDHLQSNQFVDLPGLTELQAKQAEEALAFFNAASSDTDDADPAVRLDVARACDRAGQLAQLLGRYALARDHLRRAVRYFEDLTTSDGTLENQQLLAVTLTRLGTAYLDLHDFANAEASYLKSVEIMKEVTRRQGSSSAELAFAHHNLANIYLTTNRAAAAETHLREAADIRLDLMRRTSEPTPHQRLGAAGSLTNLMLIYDASGRLDQARDTYQKVEELLGPVLKVPALKTEAALTLAGAHQNRAEQLRKQGKYPEAIALCNRGLELAEPILARDPKSAVARQRVGVLHGTRGQAHLARERYREAAADYDRLIEVTEGPNRDSYRVIRAALLAGSGDYRRALAEANDLVAKAKLAEMDQFNLACAYGMVAGAVKGATFDPDASERAIKLLQQLKAAGYFKKPGNTGLLRESSEFDSLRKLPDFQQLSRDN